MKYLSKALWMVLFYGAACSSDDPGQDPPVSYTTPEQGATWFIESESGRWLQPEGGEEFLSLAPEGLALWLSVDSISTSELDFMLAVGGPDDQDHCGRTTTMAEVELGPDGHFLFGPADFSLPNGVAAEDLIIDGHFAPDASQITKLDARGLLDLASIPAELVSALDGVDRCEVIEAILDVACVKCRDGRVECLEVELVDFVGSTRPPHSTDEIFVADCHPECELSAANVDCDQSGF